MSSAPDSSQLWAGHSSGSISIYAYSMNSTGKIEFSLAPETVLLAHRSSVTVISLSRAFSIGVSGDAEGVIVIWDLNWSVFLKFVSYVPEFVRKIKLFIFNNIFHD